MTTSFQVTIDCADPARMTGFWAVALSYTIEPPPSGFARWNDYWRSIGVPEDELDDARDAADSLVDPAGAGPRIWFQQVPEPKSTKNRLHFDLDAGGGRQVPLATRRERVTARVAQLADAGASVLRVVDADWLDHYFVVMQDPEGNEFCVR